MRSKVEIMEETLRKTAASDEKRRRKGLCLRIAGIVAACILLAIILTVLDLPSGTELPAQAGATMPDGGEAGGYVLTGVIGFSLGTLTALLSAVYEKSRQPLE